MSNISSSPLPPLPRDALDVISKYSLGPQTLASIEAAAEEMPALMTKRQVADTLDVAYRTVSRLIDQKDLEVIKMGTGRRAPVRIPRASVLDLVCRWSR